MFMMMLFFVSIYYRALDIADLSAGRKQEKTNKEQE
jgi:hypothetical protein